MSAFDALKNNRKKSLDKLKGQIDKISSKSYADPNADKYWKPTRDKAGNAFAIIRFLPGTDPSGEEAPFIRSWDHGFQGPTGLWYIEKSLNTINKDDPVSELNSQLWNSGVEDDKEQARKQKRRLKYVSNIYVVKDGANPDNEGKVFFYEYGKKIYDKINDAMFPQYEDEQAMNPFDMWEGANFRLKVRMFEGYPNYDKSEFDSSEPLLDDDDKMEEIFNQQHSLKELLDEKNFKSYSELKTKLYRVLNLTGSSIDASRTAEDDVDKNLDMSKLGKETAAPQMKEATYTSMNNASSTDEDEDDDLALFKELAKG